MRPRLGCSAWLRHEGPADGHPGPLLRRPGGRGLKNLIPESRKPGGELSARLSACPNVRPQGRGASGCGAASARWGRPPTIICSARAAMSSALSAMPPWAQARTRPTTPATTNSR